MGFSLLFSSVPMLNGGGDGESGRGHVASDPVFQRVCCIGIAEATVAALIAAKPKLPFIHVINQPYRSPGGSAHHATGIWMTDGSHYVFDWWKTLDPNNPFIYRYADWLADKNPVQFVNFKGF